jgi:hypothetical protein
VNKVPSHITEAVNAEARRNAWARDLGRELASRYENMPAAQYEDDDFAQGWMAAAEYLICKGLIDKGPGRNG